MSIWWDQIAGEYEKGNGRRADLMLSCFNAMYGVKATPDKVEKESAKRNRLPDEEEAQRPRTESLIGGREVDGGEEGREEPDRGRSRE